MFMEIIQNRYGSDRTIEKISPTKLRIMGESLINRNSTDSTGKCSMFDFEGGPCLNVGGKVRYGKTVIGLTHRVRVDVFPNKFTVIQYLFTIKTISHQTPIFHSAVV